MRQTLTIGVASVHAEPSTPGANRIVLLVHGYNNTPSEAVESYDALREKVAECGASPAALENTWEVYWHGFIAKRGQVVTLFPRDTEKTSLSWMSYADQVPVARTAGDALGQFLSKLPPTTQIIFIAHSLGSRVVLQALKVLEQSGRKTSTAAYCLMAAAVPTEFLQKGGTLRDGASIPNSHVLWSAWDRVLKYAFPRGQKRAKEPFKEAVGHAGQPREVWTSNHQTNLGHSGYYLKAAQNRYFFHGSLDTAPYLAPLFGAAIAKPVKEIQLVAWYGAGQQPLARVTLPRRDVESRVRRWFG